MPPTYHELVAQAKSRIREIAAAELEPRLGEVLLVDTREPYEHALGTLPGAVLVPRGVLESQLPAVAPDRDREIVVFCAVGNRSALAAAALQEAGYTRVSSLAGGIRGWASAGYAIAAAPLSAACSPPRSPSSEPAASGPPPPSTSPPPGSAPSP